MLASAIRDVKALEPLRYEGRVTGLEGLRIEAAGPASALPWAQRFVSGT